MTFKKNILIVTLILLSLGLFALYITNTNTSIASKNLNKQETQELHVEIKDHKFYPDVIEAKSGQKIKLIVKNNDATIEEFESQDLVREKLIQPNESIKIMLAPLNPGQYKFFGEFHQETAQGVLIIK